MAHPQRPQLPTDRERTEIIASPGCHAGSGARDRPVIQRAPGATSRDQKLIERRSAHEIRLATIEDDGNCGLHRVRRRHSFGSTAPDLPTRLGNRVAMQPRCVRRHLQSPLRRWHRGTAPTASPRARAVSPSRPTSGVRTQYSCACRRSTVNRSGSGRAPRFAPASRQPA